MIHLSTLYFSNIYQYEIVKYGNAVENMPHRKYAVDLSESLYMSGCLYISP